MANLRLAHLVTLDNSWRKARKDAEKRGNEGVDKAVEGRRKVKKETDGAMERKVEERMDAGGVLMTQWGSASHHWLFHGSLFFMLSSREDGLIRPSLWSLGLLHLSLVLTHTHTRTVASAASVYNTSRVCFTASLTYKHGSSSHQLRLFTDLYVSFNEGREGGTGLKHVALREGLIWISTPPVLQDLGIQSTLRQKLQTPHDMKDCPRNTWGQLRHWAPL